MRFSHVAGPLWARGESGFCLFVYDAWLLLTSLASGSQSNRQMLQINTERVTGEKQTNIEIIVNFGNNNRVTGEPASAFTQFK